MYQLSLYNLERQYGKLINLVNNNQVLNLATGLPQSTSPTAFQVVAVVLPVNIFYQLAQGIQKSGLPSGGLVESFDSVVLIDIKKLEGYDLDKEKTAIIYNNKRYNIIEIDDYQQQFYLLKIKAVNGPLSNIIKISMIDYVNIGESLE